MNESCKGVLLLVNDEPLDGSVLRTQFTQAGYKVLEASDEAGVVSCLGSSRVHVLIADLHRPDSEGLRFVHRVKVHSPGTQVVIMTASPSVESAVRAIKSGACEYLAKPVASEVLLEKVAALCPGTIPAGASAAGKSADCSTADGLPAGVAKVMMNVVSPGAEVQRMDAWPEGLIGGLTETIAGVERSLIAAALKRAAGNQAKAAQFLGIPRTTLRDKMAKYGMVGDAPKRQLA